MQVEFPDRKMLETIVKQGVEALDAALVETAASIAAKEAGRLEALADHEMDVERSREHRAAARAARRIEVDIRALSK